MTKASWTSLPSVSETRKALTDKEDVLTITQATEDTVNACFRG